MRRDERWRRDAEVRGVGREKERQRRGGVAAKERERERRRDAEEDGREAPVTVLNSTSGMAGGYLWGAGAVCAGWRRKEWRGSGPDLESARCRNAVSNRHWRMGDGTRLSRHGGELKAGDPGGGGRESPRRTRPGHNIYVMMTQIMAHTQIITVRIVFTEMNHKIFRSQNIFKKNCASVLILKFVRLNFSFLPMPIFKMNFTS